MLEQKVTKPIFILLAIGFVIYAAWALAHMHHDYKPVLDLDDYVTCRSAMHSPSNMDDCVKFMTQDVPAAFENSDKNPLSDLKVSNGHFIELYNDIQSYRKTEGFEPLPSLEELTHGKLKSQS